MPRKKKTEDVERLADESSLITSPIDEPHKITVEELEARIGIKLEDWQKIVVTEEKLNIIMRCSRKSGKTTAMAFKIVLDALNNPDWFVCILSAGQRQSSEVFQTVVAMLYKLEAGFRERPNATGCTLSNGHRILSLPTGYTGGTIRTYSFDKIYYDEAAFIADEVYKATMPCLLKHGKQKIIASTPKGSRGFFYEEWQNGKGFIRFYIPYWEIRHIPQERIRETVESERAISGDKYIQQEYEALFVEQGAGLIPERLINQCTTSIGYAATDGKNYLGVTSAPLGKNYHYIVCCQSNRDKIRITSLEIVEHNDRTNALLARLQEIAAVRRIDKVITSETSVGVGTLGAITHLFGRKRVLSVESLSYIKEKIADGRRGKVNEKDMYDYLVTLMEKMQIEIIDDPILIDALRSLDYDVKPKKENEIVIFGRAKVIAEALVYSIVPNLLKPPRHLWVDGWIPQPLSHLDDIY